MQGLMAIILAAGEGTRMKSKKSKVVHKIAGKTLIEWVIKAANEAEIDEKIVVIGHMAEQVKEVLVNTVKYVTQEKKLGTGHAVMQAAEYIDSFKGYILILAGDVPLISGQTIKKALEKADSENLAAVVISGITENPTGYGRIIRNAEGYVDKIVEELDASAEERKVNEINSSIYIFNAELLSKSLKLINNNNKKGEYYLTDTIAILRSMNEKIAAVTVGDFSEIMGINDKVQLFEASKIISKKINYEHMRNGVVIIDPNSTYIDDDIKIGIDTVIYPNTILENGTQIGEDCEIGPNSRLVAAQIGNSTKIINSVVLESSVGNDTKIGPFSYIRPESVIGNNIKIGDFVEIKKSTIGDKTSISHLTYVGDGVVGKNVNIGCGVVFVNYDGQKKQKTIIGDNAFIGCNTNLIAPVEIGENAYTAAGSTITKAVPEFSLGVAREKQVNLEGWVKRTNRERKEKK